VLKLFMQNIKYEFPIFNNNPNLIYLDSASTTQKPLKVINTITEFYTKFNSNVHRGSYPISEEATEEFENTRIKVARFIGAKPSEIIFTSSTTDSLNLASELIFYNNLVDENGIISVPREGHHSLILPFRRFFRNQRFYNDYSDIDKTSEIALITHVSNVTGKITDPRNIKSKLKVLDCAQSIGHMSINVNDLNVDFLAFSAHKMYGPMGIGVLWVRGEILKKCNPVRLGGGTVNLVKRENIEFINIPNRFEPGTPNVASVLGLAAAIDFLSDIDIQSHLENKFKLKMLLLESLRKIGGLRIFTDMESKLGIISISHDRIHAHDIASFLGEKGICVRAGHHCTHIYHKEVLKVPATVRFSIGLYNDEDQIEKACIELSNALKLLMI
jgi:cysteine desulfurase/selenocysteine lyase